MEYVLKTNGLTKNFSGKNAVDHVDMHVKRGDIYGFIGKNGAGKTTLIRLAVGLAAPTEGSIELFGSTDCIKHRSRIGTVIEYPAFYPNMTAYENLIAEAKTIGKSDKGQIAEILKLVGLEDTGKKKAKNFSMGMKQRLALAQALLGESELLILDEPTNGLDPEGIREIRELILKLNKEKGITFLISSHILGELSKLATCYGIIHNGKLLQEFSEDDQLEWSKPHIALQVNKDDVRNACRILKEQLGIADFRFYQDGKIQINEESTDTVQINEKLTKEGIRIEAISLEKTDLEEYFMNVIGGTGA